MYIHLITNKHLWIPLSCTAKKVHIKTASKLGGWIDGWLYYWRGRLGDGRQRQLCRYGWIYAWTDVGSMPVGYPYVWLAWQTKLKNNGSLHMTFIILSTWALMTRLTICTLLINEIATYATSVLFYWGTWQQSGFPRYMSQNKLESSILWRRVPRSKRYRYAWIYVAGNLTLSLTDWMSYRCKFAWICACSTVSSNERLKCIAWNIFISILILA